MATLNTLFKDTGYLTASERSSHRRNASFTTNSLCLNSPSKSSTQPTKR